MSQKPSFQNGAEYVKIMLLGFLLESILDIIVFCTKISNVKKLAPCTFCATCALKWILWPRNQKIQKIIPKPVYTHAHSSHQINISVVSFDLTPWG